LFGGYGVGLQGADHLTNHGFIQGGYSPTAFAGTGVYLAPNAGAGLTNTGTILGGSGYTAGATGAFAAPGDYILNKGVISGGVGRGTRPTDGGGAGILVDEGTVVNSGLITGGAGLDALSGDYSSGGLLEGGVIDNTGTIAGASGTFGGEGLSVYGGTLINAGTIAGALEADGTLANAVTMETYGNPFATTLIVDPGAVFIGDVVAGPTLADVIVFAATASAATLSGLGTQFTGFSALDFAAGGQWTISGSANAFDGSETISGFAAGDAIMLDGFTAASHHVVAGGLEITDTSGTEITLDLTGDLTVTDQPGGAEIETAVCYLRGTRIFTPAGDIAVEKLNIGDPVVTLRNGYQKIKWIGRQNFARCFVAKNRDLMPVRIAAGALGPQIPKRDLFVSPGHSMLIGGVLVLAKFLVNGITITQDFAGDRIDYYQLEFETHDCVLAEGAWSESYADTPGLRGKFHNAAEFFLLYPDYQEPLHQTLCAPRPMAGPALECLLRPIVARAAATINPGKLRGYIDDISTAGHIRGWAWDVGNPELPVLLEIAVGGRVIGTVLACDYRGDLLAAGYGQGNCGFLFVSPVGLPINLDGVQIRRAVDSAALPMPNDFRSWLAAA
jgi:hypothetical protein